MASTLMRVDDVKDLRTLVDDYERRLILSALGASGGQKNRAAALLGVLPTTLHEKIKRLGLANAGPHAVPAGTQTVLLGERRQEFRWHGHLSRGAVLEIRGMAGGVRAGLAEGEDVEVVALRSGRSPEGPISLSVLEHEGGALFSVCETRPGPHRPGTATSRPRVEFEVRVPAGVSLVVRILSGNIEITGLTGEVEASTTSGQVRLLAPRAMAVPEARGDTVVRTAGLAIPPIGEDGLASRWQVRA